MVRKDSQHNLEKKREISILNQMKLQSKSKVEKASRQKVSELKANKQVERLELVVLRRYPRRLVNSTNFTDVILI